MAGSEVYIEMIRLGTIVKVNAVDANTGVEVSIQGPASTSQEQLKKIAIDKLHYRLRQLVKER